MLFNHLRYRSGYMWPLPDGGLRCVTWNTRGLVGSVLSSQRNRELKLNYFGKLLENNAPRFKSFGTFVPGNENAGGSAICIHEDLVPEDAIVDTCDYLPRP